MYVLICVLCMIFKESLTNENIFQNETKTEGDTFNLDCQLGVSEFQGLKITTPLNKSVAVIAEVKDGQPERSCKLITQAEVTYRYNFSCDAENAILRVQLDNVSNDDHWTTFVCRTKTKSVSTLLKVNVPVTHVTMNQTVDGKWTVDTKTPGHMQCTTSPSRPKAFIYWHAQTKQLNTTDSVKTEYMSTQGNLTVTKGTLSYRGEPDDNGKTLYCTAENGFGQQTSSGVVLNVLYGPTEIKIYPDKLVFEDGYDTTPLTCSADCNPPCNIHWLRDDKEVTNQQILNLGVATKDKAGIYTCYVDNDYGNTSKDVNVIVPYIKVGVSPKKVSCSQGGNINVQCSVTGDPPHVNLLPWEHRFGSKVIQTLSNIEIKNCTYEDMGTYVCRANNSVGMYKEDTVEVEIKAEPVIVVLPGKGTNTSDLTEVRVFIYASPPLKRITLLRNGSILPNVKQYTHHSNGRLKIHGVDVMVQGKQVRLVAVGHTHSTDAYEIQAQNDVGITKQYVYQSHTSSSDVIDNINDASEGGGNGVVAVIVIVFVMGFVAVTVAIWYRKRRIRQGQEESKNTTPKHEDSRIAGCKDPNPLLTTDGDEMVEKTEFPCVSYQSSSEQNEDSRPFKYATPRCFNDYGDGSEEETGAE